MSITAEQIKAVADKLLAVAEAAGKLNPAVGLGVSLLTDLFSAGVEFNQLLKAVHDQTPETADAVLDAVIADYAASSDAVRAAVEANKPTV